MNPYDYHHDAPQASLQLKKDSVRWLSYTVTFPTACPTPLAEGNMVRGEYYQPKQGSIAPLAILVHGMGDSSLIPCQLLARALVKQGIACFILYLVFHSSRMSAAVKGRFPELTGDEWFQGYQLSVIDIRQVVDWAYQRAELNREQIAILGISFGGLVSAIAMGIDRRIKAGVLITAGGNSEKMIWLSKANRYRTRYQCTEAEYQQIQSSYARYLAQVSQKGFQQVTPPRRGFLTDPMTFASYLRHRPLLMINALWDKYIPREAVLDFWQACGQPPLRWFPAGHSSLWLWYPAIRRQISGFLRSALDMG